MFFHKLGPIWQSTGQGRLQVARRGERGPRYQAFTTCNCQHAVRSRGL